MSVNFNDEKEVQEFLDNIGIEYRFGCYSEKKPDVCHLLADYLEAIRRDFDKARKVYKMTCDDLSYARSCEQYANYTLVGRGESGTKPNPTEALEYYGKGCSLKDEKSCLKAGLLSISAALGDKRDYNKSIEYLTQGCELNNDIACFHLAGMYIGGVKKQPQKKSAQKKPKDKSSFFTPTDLPPVPPEYHVQKNMELSFKYMYKACELKNVLACANLSEMYARGDGTEKDMEKAQIYKKRAQQMKDEIENVSPLSFGQSS